jgi:hypothetical protein
MPRVMHFEIYTDDLEVVHPVSRNQQYGFIQEQKPRQVY